MVNIVGLDLNEIVAHKHLSAQLQFISGLGPRKAFHIIQMIETETGPLKLRNEFHILKILEKTVYYNAIGFLKIKEWNQNDKFYNILDQTRIHPESKFYFLLKLKKNNEKKEKCI